MPADVARIEAGKLRHLINIVKPAATQDSFGGVSIDQADETIFARVWAKIETLTQSRYLREVYAAQQKVAQISHLITIRWLPGVASNMNVVFRNRLFQIQGAADPDENQHVLVLLCLERDGSAMETPPVPGG